MCRAKKSSHSIPYDLDTDAKQDEGAQPDDDIHGRLPKEVREPFRESIAKKDAQRNEGGADDGWESRSTGFRCISVAPSVSATEIDPGPTVSGRVRG